MVVLLVAILTPFAIGTALDLVFPRPPRPFEACAGLTRPEEYRRCFDATGGWEADAERQDVNERNRTVATIFCGVATVAGALWYFSSPLPAPLAGLALGGILTLLNAALAASLSYQMAGPDLGNTLPGVALLGAALGAGVTAWRYIVVSREGLERTSPERTAVWLVPLASAVASTIVAFQFVLGVINFAGVMMLPLVLTWLAILITTVQLVIPAVALYAARAFRRRRWSGAMLLLASCFAGSFWPVPFFVYLGPFSGIRNFRPLLVVSGQLSWTEIGRNFPLVFAFVLLPLVMAMMSVLALLPVAAVMLRGDCRRALE
jgi:hypothetical protein